MPRTYLKTTNIMDHPDSQYPDPVEMVVSEDYVNELHKRQVMKFIKGLKKIKDDTLKPTNELKKNSKKINA